MQRNYEHIYDNNDETSINNIWNALFQHAHVYMFGSFFLYGINDAVNQVLENNGNIVILCLMRCLIIHSVVFWIILFLNIL